MAFDTHKNLAISSVATAPSPPTTGQSLTVAAGQGARFDEAPPFQITVWPATAMADPTNAEILRVTARAGDVFSVLRAQEGTIARAIGLGDLVAETITAKNLRDIETQAALLAAPNVFTATPQVMSCPVPQFMLRDTAAPADARLFDLVNYSQVFAVRALNDANTVVQSTPLLLNRAGDLQAGRDLYEKGRPFPVGHWVAEPFNAAHYSALAPMVWTVAPENVTSRYTLVGNTLSWSVGIATSALTGTPTNNLFVTLPAGRGIPGTLMAGTGYSHSGSWVPLMIQFTAGTSLYIFRQDLTPFPVGNLILYFSLTFETI